MFQRPHHRLIASVLKSLDARLLAEHRCYFGGGTSIVLRHGEYRESVDLDFLVSDASSYRDLRLLVKKSDSVNVFFNKQAVPIESQYPKVDQYGIRTFLKVLDQTVKFEIVQEGRISFDLPGRKDRVCGVTTLNAVDSAASKILANSDRWADAGVFSRDILDLAMMTLDKKTFMSALNKADGAYGDSAKRDLQKAMTHLKERPEHLARCCRALSMTLTAAEAWQKLRRIQKWL